MRLIHKEVVYFYPIFFATGIGLYFLLYNEPALYWSIIAGLIGAMLAVKGFICISLLFLGFTIAYTRAHLLNTYSITDNVYKIPIKGIVQQVEYYPSKKRIILTNAASPEVKLPHTIRLRIKKADTLHVGDSIEGTANIMPLSCPASPFSFNIQRDAFFKGIGATGRLTQFSVICRHKGLLNALDRFRDQTSTRLRARINGDEKEIAVALITGDKTGLSPTVQDAFSKAGISHLLAISGLHLSLIAAIFFFIVRYASCFVALVKPSSFSSQKIAAITAILVSFIYLLFSGAGYPVQRAFVMISLFMGAILIDRTAFSMRSVSFAALIVLLIRPESILSVSFQLSFAAVIALIAVCEVMPYLSRLYAPLRWFASTTIVTLAASFATAPFTAVTFNQFTLESVLGNLLGIPLFSFVVMPLGILSFVFGWIFYGLWEKSIALLMYIATWVSGLPGSHIVVHKPSTPLFLLLFVFGGLWLCLWRERVRYWGVIPMLGSIFFYSKPAPPDIFVADYGKVVAWRDGATLLTCYPNRGKYFLEEWSKNYGLTVSKAEHLPDDIKIIEDYTQEEHAKVLISRYYIEKKDPGSIILDRSNLDAVCLVWIGTHKILNMRDVFGHRLWHHFS